MPSEVSGFRRPLNQKNRGTLNHVALYLSSYAPFDSHVVGGVLAITFAVIQFVPGGPVEQMVQQLTQGAVGGETAGHSMPGTLAKNGNRISAEDLAALNALYGFDKPPVTRFVDMVWKFARSIWVRAFSITKLYLSW